MEIVVGPHLQSENAIHIVTFGGQHQDRDRTLGSQVAAQHQPVFPRQHEIENDQINLMVFDQFPHLRAIFRKQNVVTPLAEILLQQLSQFTVVIDDEYRFFHVGVLGTNR